MIWFISSKGKTIRNRTYTVPKVPINPKSNSVMLIHIQLDHKMISTNCGTKVFDLGFNGTAGHLMPLEKQNKPLLEIFGGTPYSCSHCLPESSAAVIGQWGSTLCILFKNCKRVQNTQVWVWQTTTGRCSGSRPDNFSGGPCKALPGWLASRSANYGHRALLTTNHTANTTKCQFPCVISASNFRVFFVCLPSVLTLNSSHKENDSYSCSVFYFGPFCCFVLFSFILQIKIC